MEQFLRAQEQRWLDQPVPALEGHTPRQAAADPTLLPDLRTLLAECSASEAGFDPERLRALLGL